MAIYVSVFFAVFTLFAFTVSEAAIQQTASGGNSASGSADGSITTLNANCNPQQLLTSLEISQGLSVARDVNCFLSNANGCIPFQYCRKCQLKNYSLKTLLAPQTRQYAACSTLGISSKPLIPNSNVNCSSYLWPNEVKSGIGISFDSSCMQEAQGVGCISSAVACRRCHYPTNEVHPEYWPCGIQQRLSSCAQVLSISEKSQGVLAIPDSRCSNDGSDVASVSGCIPNSVCRLCTFTKLPSRKELPNCISIDNNSIQNSAIYRPFITVRNRADDGEGPVSGDENATDIPTFMPAVITLDNDITLPTLEEMSYLMQNFSMAMATNVFQDQVVYQITLWCTVVGAGSFVVGFLMILYYKSFGATKVQKLTKGTELCVNQDVTTIL